MGAFLTSCTLGGSRAKARITIGITKLTRHCSVVLELTVGTRGHALLRVRPQIKAHKTVLAAVLVVAIGAICWTRQAGVGGRSPSPRTFFQARGRARHQKFATWTGQALRFQRSVTLGTFF